jgi:hypothetical protein
MQIWFKMDLTQSHLRTSFQIFAFNRAETSSFAQPVPITYILLKINISQKNSIYQ